jgi:hypothetical protein
MYLVLPHCEQKGKANKETQNIALFFAIMLQTSFQFGITKPPLVLLWYDSSFVFS